MKLSHNIAVTLFIAETMLHPLAFAQQVGSVYTIQQNFEKLASEKSTYLNLWVKIRGQYSRQDQSLIDAWILQQNNSQNKNKEIKTTLVKSGDGDNGLRAFVETHSGSNSYDIKVTKNDELVINKISADELDISDIDQQIRKLSRGTFNKEILLSQTQQELEPEIVASLSSEQKAIYLIHQRKMLELSRKVLTPKKASARYKPGRIFFLLITPEEAIAATGAKCFNRLGYITTLDTSGNCPDSVVLTSQYTNVSCSNGQLCNPSYYGLSRTTSGQGVCLTSADIAAARSCSDLAPLKTQDDVRSLMSSLMKASARPEKPPEGGKSPLADFIEQALRSCEESNLQSSDSCKELMNRKTLINGFMVDAKGQRMGPGNNRQASGNRPARDSAGESDTSGFASSSASGSNNDCGFFCSTGRWLTSTTGIMSMLTVATGVGVYLWTKNKYKKKSTTTASTSTATDTTVTTTGSYTGYGLPATPTSFDYTGVAQ